MFRVTSVLLATLCVEHWSASTSHWTDHRLHRHSRVALHGRIQAWPEVEVRIVEKHAQIERTLNSLELDRVDIALELVSLRNKVCVCNVICAKSIINDFHLVIEAHLGRTFPTFILESDSGGLCVWNRRHLNIVYQLERRCSDVYFLRNIKGSDLRHFSFINRG